MKKVSILLGLVLSFLLFFSMESETAEAASGWKYDWDFKTQTVTVPLNKTQYYTGKEVYRAFGSVGINVAYKVSNTTLTVTGVSDLDTTFFPVSLSVQNAAIITPNAKVGKTASAAVRYKGAIAAFNGTGLYSEPVRTEAYLKLVSVDTNKKTAKVQISGHLLHTSK